MHLRVAVSTAAAKSIYNSPLTRTRETASIVGEGVRHDACGAA